MRTAKLPLAYVAKHVDELYDKQFDPKDLASIDKHCDFIREFINACGWDEMELIQAMHPLRPLDTTSS